MLRFQQYIELVRTQDQAKLLESISHAKKYLLPFREAYPKEVQQACGLLAFPPGTKAEAYSVSLLPCSPLTICTTIMYNNNVLLANSVHRISTANPVGPPSPTSSPTPTTLSSPYPPFPSSTSPSLPVSPRSKLPPVTPRIHTRLFPPYHLPLHPPSQHLCVRSALRNSMIWRETCRMHIIRPVMWNPIWSCCRTDVSMGCRDSKSIVARRGVIRGWLRI